jgi:long-chain acyl-CoA synthetase
MTASPAAFAGPPAPQGAAGRGRTLASVLLGPHTGPAVRFPGGEWSHEQLARRVRDLATGLIGLGIEFGDGVSILGSTRPEWTLSDAAALVAGAVVVPIYHTNSAEECAYVLAHSGARAVICEDAAQVDKIRAIRGECPALEHVIAMTPVAGVPTIADIAAAGAHLNADAVTNRAARVRPEDVATIVYTSGTTGPPKGCRLTHANCVATMDAYERLLDLEASAVVFMFLPLAHVLARMTQMVALDVGGTIAFSSGDTSRLVEDIGATRPTHVPSVPRVFEKIRTRALAAAEEGGPAKKLVFRWALRVGARMRAAERAGHAPGLLLRREHALADRLVLSKVRGLFGGDLELALTGAAPIAGDVLEFFDACGVLVLEGWGMTETCAAGTLNTLDAFRFGSVGRPLPMTDVAVADDGELLVRGPSVFDGYHRDPDATAEVFDGDWLLTGDLAEVDPDGFVRITGRKKDLIITSSGKNISPANIEAALRESRWISQAVVAGDNKPYLVALVTLDPEEAPALAAELGIEADLAAMAADRRVHEVLQGEVDAANERFARIEQVKRFGVLDHDLTQAEGELTPTLKVKRALVEARYRERIEALYG